MEKLKVVGLFKGDAELVLIVEVRTGWVKAAVHATKSTATSKFGVRMVGPLEPFLVRAKSEGWGMERPQ